jgi:hypothetical protein
MKNIDDTGVPGCFDSFEFPKWRRSRHAVVAESNDIIKSTMLDGQEDSGAWVRVYSCTVTNTHQSSASLRAFTTAALVTSSLTQIPKIGSSPQKALPVIQWLTGTTAIDPR